MKIQHIMQPRGSYVCAQSCIAMVKGLDLAAGCALVGHSRKTKTKELLAALGPMAGSDRLQRVGRDLPSFPAFCILRVRWGVTSCGHFVVVKDGIVYDPLRSRDTPFGPWLLWLGRNDGRITSFLPLIEDPLVLTGEEVFRSLSPEEAARVPPIHESVIREALAKGAEERRLAAGVR